MARYLTELHMNAIHFHRFAHWLYQQKIPFLPMVVRNLMFLVFNSYIPPSAEIGEGSVFAYGAIGVVIHANSKIGKNCVIGQGITIGASEAYVSPDAKACPTIGDNCYIGAGARILGGIHIGSNSVVAAGAVVLNDVPEHSVVVGVPAKVIGQTNADYLAIRKAA